ncbi:MAG TPA: hypothetical protein VJ691_07165 [Vicinamibacterales bacterium]|nr:hypothetical protein [Vicinamibacterales bacterium]
MIAFVTSLRARALAGDKWEYHVWLLERVVHSMLAQERGEIRVVVACHDLPETALSRDPRVHFERLSVAIPERDFDDMAVDKVLKLSAGARRAAAQGCRFVVFNDADDLVSNRIGAHVTERPDANGWYAVSQMFYTYGGRLMRRQRIADPASGPCVVVRSDLLTFDRPPFDRSPWARMVAAGGEQRYLDLLARHQAEVCILAAVGIAYYRSFMAGAGFPLDPLPFPANVVINHADSMSTTGGTHGYQRLSSLGSLKRSLRWLPTLRYVTAQARREFHIPDTAAIPPQYRGGASVFWR